MHERRSADSSQYSRTECHFVCLEKVKTNKINLLTQNSSPCVITVSAYVILKHVIEGKTERKMEVQGRGGKRCKQLLDDLKEKRRYFREEALNRTVWRTRFVRGYGPVIKQIRKMTERLTPVLTPIYFCLQTLHQLYFHIFYFKFLHFCDRLAFDLAVRRNYSRSVQNRRCLTTSVYVPKVRIKGRELIENVRKE